MPTPATRPRSMGRLAPRRSACTRSVSSSVSTRRWALPNRLATAIERHHADDAENEAALVRLADMLAHYGHAQTVNPKQLLQAARACGLTTEQLRSVMYELPQGTGNAKRNVD